MRYVNRKADEVVAVSRKGDRVSTPQAISSRPGQYIRPAVAASGNDVWCVWTRTEPDRVASIEFSRWQDGAWSPARRLLPDETRPHQNPEIAAGPDGRLAVVYQIHVGREYDIALLLWNGKEWLAPQTLSAPGANDWDPAVAFDAQGR